MVPMNKCQPTLKRKEYQVDYIKSHCSTWKCCNCLKESCCIKAYKTMIWIYKTSSYQYGCSKYINIWDITDKGQSQEDDPYR